MSLATPITLTQRLGPLRELVDQALENYLRFTDGCPDRLADAMRYSVMAPGKRPAALCWTLLAAEAVGGHARSALPAACAVELIHAYSLIHDDLPAMDNDDLRRGLPTCHRKFDEATAILAGDALQALAFEILSHEMPAERALRCCQILSRAAGRSQLVGGQADDLAAEGAVWRPNLSKADGRAPPEYSLTKDWGDNSSQFVPRGCSGWSSGESS